ncbi:MAG: hypothetical protein ACTSRW_16775, partial [Candidatus Helarchaeota archaeon]
RSSKKNNFKPISVLEIETAMKTCLQTDYKKVSSRLASKRTENGNRRDFVLIGEIDRHAHNRSKN